MQQSFPMKSGFLLIIVILAWGLTVRASDEPGSKRPDKEPLIGYVVCSDRESEPSVPMLLDLCTKLPAGRIGCGQSVSVLQRRGDWVEIALPDKHSRYLPANIVSQNADKSVPFDANSGLPDQGAADCAVPNEHRETRPSAIYSPDPEYSEKARKKKIGGTVVLSLIVGIDGAPRDIKVYKNLGYGLDEKAMEAVQKWKFQPAVKNGQPVETQIYIEVTFRVQ